LGPTFIDYDVNEVAVKYKWFFYGGNTIECAYLLLGW